MAAYDYVPPEKPYPKVRKRNTPRTQRPGHPADNGHMFVENSKELPAKKAVPVTKRQRAAQSNGLDTTNRPTKVGGNGSARDTLAQGARKAGTPSPKTKVTDKKVGGKGKK